MELSELAKLSSVGRDLDQYSLETVRGFRRDAVEAGFQIALEQKSLLDVAYVRIVRVYDCCASHGML